MRLYERAKNKARFTAQRWVMRAGRVVGLYAYEPSAENRKWLDELTEYIEDGRPIRDKRPTTLDEVERDLTITLEGLEDILELKQFRGRRVLEVGPKYGIHSLWLDRVLEPAELVFCDFAEDKHRHESWKSELRSPHSFVYGDLREANELTAMAPFGLVFFLGVMYHSVYHLPLLVMLNKVTQLGGTVLFETTFDPRPDACVRLRWQSKTGKAKAVPSIEALRVMLAWTGFRRVRHLTDYRPGSSEAIFLCEKTDELEPGRDFAAIVRPPRLPS